jgi:hypothetical protein
MGLNGAEPASSRAPHGGVQPVARNSERSWPAQQPWPVRPAGPAWAAKQSSPCWSKTRAIREEQIYTDPRHSHQGKRSPARGQASPPKPKPAGVDLRTAPPFHLTRAGKPFVDSSCRRGIPGKRACSPTHTAGDSRQPDIGTMLPTACSHDGEAVAIDLDAATIVGKIPQEYLRVAQPI